MRYFIYCRKSSEGEERQALSIPAQIDEIQRAFGASPDIEIVDWFEEKMSAKAPGRPVYAQMMARIERGEAHGLIAWHPDRLARNSVDGGWLIHLLDRNVLQDLKFAAYRFEKSPEGMFMLQIMFGQSKYYVDNLSVNVKRGLRKKIEMGWLPNKAPLGYLNDPATGTIIPDPDRFAVVRQMWDLLLSGRSVRVIRDTAGADWGLRTPKRRRIGGQPIALASTYRVFRNPFYAGVLETKGERRMGKHQPMITLDEFDRARAILARPGSPKPVRQTFAYTGLLRCACGLMITAERKTKPSGRSYIYYHCTRRKYPRCRQPSVTRQELEALFEGFFRTLRLPEHHTETLTDLAAEARSEDMALSTHKANSLAKSLEEVQSQLRTLVDLRIRNLIDDNEFLKRQSVLRTEETRYRQGMQYPHPYPTFELVTASIELMKHCADWYGDGSDDEKRLLVQILCQNPRLIDKKLSLEARFPFFQISNPADCLHLRSVVYDVGTRAGKSGTARTIIQVAAYFAARARARKRKKRPLSFPEFLRTFEIGAGKRGPSGGVVPSSPHPPRPHPPQAMDGLQESVA